MQKNEPGLNLKLLTKINLKCIKHVNIRPKTEKVLGKKKNKTSLTFIGDDILARTPKA